MEQSNSHKLFKGMSVQTVVTIVMGILSIISFSLFSRIMSKETFGYFAALNAVLVIFKAFSEAGLGTAVIQKKDCTDKYFSNAFTLSLLISSFLAVFLFLGAPFLSDFVADEKLIIPLRLLSPLLIIGSLSSVGTATLTRDLQFAKIGAINIVSYIISYGVGIFLAFKGIGLFSLVISELLFSIMVCVFVFVFGAKTPRLSLNLADTKNIIHFGGWQTASVLANQMTAQLDKFVLGKWLSVAVLGAYSRPSGFVTTITDRINGIFDTALFPILSSIQDETERIKWTFATAISLLNSFSIILAACFFFNAELIITIFFGTEWLSLVGVFRIISISVIFAIDGRLADCYFRSLALVKQNFIIRISCMFLMLLGLYIGSSYGIIGIAFGVVTANLLAVVIKVVYLCRRINLNLTEVASCFFLSLKPIIPILIIGVPYMLFIDKTILMNNLCFAFIFFAVCVLVFFIKPSMVSSSYCKFIAPYRYILLNILKGKR